MSHAHIFRYIALLAGMITSTAQAKVQQEQVVPGIALSIASATATDIRTITGADAQARVNAMQWRNVMISVPNQRVKDSV